MPKRTQQPSKIKRARRHGFRKRAQDNSGKKTLKRRRQKKRALLTV